MPIDSSGFDEVDRDLNSLESRVRQGLARRADSISQPLVDQAQEYGPELPNQRYPRTYTLRDGWRDSQPQVTASSNGIAITHVNPVDYTEDVQGVGVQKPTFAERWDDLQTVADKATPAVVTRLRDALDDILQGGF